MRNTQNYDAYYTKLQCIVHQTTMHSTQNYDTKYTNYNGKLHTSYVLAMYVRHRSLQARGLSHSIVFECYPSRALQQLLACSSDQQYFYAEGYYQTSIVLLVSFLVMRISVAMRTSTQHDHRQYLWHNQQIHITKITT